MFGLITSLQPASRSCFDSRYRLLTLPSRIMMPSHGTHFYFVTKKKTCLKHEVSQCRVVLGSSVINAGLRANAARLNYWNAIPLLRLNHCTYPILKFQPLAMAHGFRVCRHQCLSFLKRERNTIYSSFSPLLGLHLPLSVTRYFSLFERVEFHPLNYPVRGRRTQTSESIER